MSKAIIEYVKAQYPEGFIPMHAPVEQFEAQMSAYTGAAHTTAVVNGTSGIHIALHVLDVGPEDAVITQPLTFVATCNAIAYTGALPLFDDVDEDTMGLSPTALAAYLEEACQLDGTQCRHKATGRLIKACLPMHTFGFPCRIQELVALCERWCIPIVEDAAESLGSRVGDRHTGTFGRLGVFSFNGNKIATAGGGGAVVTQAVALGQRIKHLTTTAKQPHRWAYRHETLGFNYRMPNINAALACAQLESLPQFLENKRQLALAYQAFFATRTEQLLWERAGTSANFWLNTLRVSSSAVRDSLLMATNEVGVMTRPVWELMTDLPMYQNCPKGPLPNATLLSQQIVNLPSSVRL